MTFPNGKVPVIPGQQAVPPVGGSGSTPPTGPAPSVEFQRLLDQLTELHESSRALGASAPEHDATTKARPEVEAGTDPTGGLPRANNALPPEPADAPDDGDSPGQLAADLARAEDHFRFAMDLSKQLRDAFEQRLT